MIRPSGPDVRRGQSIALAWCEVDALALITRMIDELVPATAFEHLVREFGPSLTRVLDPFVTGKRPALRCAAALGVRTSKPLLARTGKRRRSVAPRIITCACELGSGGIESCSRPSCRLWAHHRGGLFLSQGWVLGGFSGARRRQSVSPPPLCEHLQATMGPPAHGGQESGDRRCAPHRRDEDGGPQDRGDLSPVCDCGRGDDAVGGGEARGVDFIHRPGRIRATFVLRPSVTWSVDLKRTEHELHIGVGSGSVLVGVGVLADGIDRRDGHQLEVVFDGAIHADPGSEGAS